MAGKDFENVKALGTVFSLGAMVAAGTMFGYWTGSYLDRKLGTDPWFTIIMVFVGVIASFKSVYDIMVSGKGGE